MDPLKVQQPQEIKLHFLDYWRIIRIRKTVILAVFLLVVITATLVTFILPESFASSARIKIERENPDVSGIGSQQNPLGIYDPYFIQTEFELIQSEAILGKVIEARNLNAEWGKKYGNGDKLLTTATMAILKARMDLRPVRNTSLIEIRVYSENRQEAADLANAIADAYAAHRQEQISRRVTGGIKALEAEVAQQEGVVRNIQIEMERLRKELDISDMDAAGTAPTPLLESDTLRKIEALRIEREMFYSGRAAQLNQLSPLPPDKLRQVLPTTIQDTSLTEFLSQLNIAEQRLLALRKDQGEDHPDLKNTKEQIKLLNQKIDDRVSGIMYSLTNQVETAKAEVDVLKRQVEEAKRLDREKAEKSRPYFEKKGELEEAKRLRTILNMRVAQEKTDINLPHTTMVEVVDKAVPGPRPVRPNKPLNIVLGVIIGLVVGIGLAFFIEYLDTSVKTIDDVERTLQSPVLGVIPQNAGYLFEEGSESPHAEAYRVLRTNLLFSRKDDKLNSIAVVSAGAGEGKSTTVMNLATVFAQSDARVVVVDSDLRRPTLHKMLGVSNSLGLTNYLLRQNKLEEVIQRSSIPNLDFLPSGKLPSSSLGILSSNQMKDLISDLKQRYDFVFLDSPPVMGVSDASILASEVDLTLQVIQYRRYPQPMNIRAKQLIEKVGGNLVGIVLNNINMSQDESYYYYSGYYHDYYSKNEDSTPEADTKDSDKKAKVEIKQKY